jgi:hypothetical protein
MLIPHFISLQSLSVAHLLLLQNNKVVTVLAAWLTDKETNVRSSAPATTHDAHLLQMQDGRAVAGGCCSLTHRPELV